MHRQFACHLTDHREYDQCDENQGHKKDLHRLLKVPAYHFD
ncbi:hypothetical protein JL2886_02310 [Phaeobacter gallaeciensis]|uniref:Uncharacterized protein n=1 Tax=Phaeobacter gallaeciensis TaxID=60890 RepID=A0A1B0ZSX3_9RHOB|nr:hypothetical protein JL2886_02310 [Phaeobacter gallaeciensis]